MNPDKLKRFPNQNLENRPFECVGETIADIVGNITGTPMDPGFSYAAGIKVSGKIPNNRGTDIYSGMLGAILYGALPTEKEAFDATTTSDLYEANIANYDLTAALPFVQKGTVTIPTYGEIYDYWREEGLGVALGLKWYENFNTPNPDGSLPLPQGGYSLHCVAVYGDTLKGLRIKPWLGPDYGDGGYAYLNETIFPMVNYGAWAFDPQASRSLSIFSAQVYRAWLRTTAPFRV